MIVADVSATDIIDSEIQLLADLLYVRTGGRWLSLVTYCVLENSLNSHLIILKYSIQTSCCNTTVRYFLLQVQDFTNTNYELHQSEVNLI